MFVAGKAQKTTKTYSSTIPGTGCWNDSRNLNCCSKNCPQNTTRQTFSQPIYFLPKQISAEFQDRLWKIDKLKRKYEIFTLSMMPPEGEEMKSQAYYAIKVFYQHHSL